MTVIRVIVKPNETAKSQGPAGRMSVQHEPAYGKRVDIEKGVDTFQSFLRKCVEVLELECVPKRVFDQEGNPIHTIHEIVAQDTYYMSKVSNVRSQTHSGRTFQHAEQLQ